LPCAVAVAVAISVVAVFAISVVAFVAAIVAVCRSCWRIVVSEAVSVVVVAAPSIRAMGIFLKAMWIGE
jgi:hypothetical protein